MKTFQIKTAILMIFMTGSVVAETIISPAQNTEQTIPYDDKINEWSRQSKIKKEQQKPTY